MIGVQLHLNIDKWESWKGVEDQGIADRRQSVNNTSYIRALLVL